MNSTSRALRARPQLLTWSSAICLCSALTLGCGSDNEPRDDGSGGKGHGGMVGETATNGDGDGDGSTDSSGGTGGTAPFMLGVDISSIPEAMDRGATYWDTDGIEKPALELFAAHGFNTVRLRTFVDPMATYGYAYGDGSASCLKSEAYCDLSQTLEFGRSIKEAGMALMVDFHYSDNWADPGKQLIPEAWRDAQTIEELAERVKSYTKDSILTLVEGGARPDVVQIGNEITPGMLIHVPTPSTDCWGNNSARNELGGSINNWDHLATLLRAGIEGVHEVDPQIKTLVHIENTDDPDGAMYWIEQALEHDVQFDILGLSCYPAYQGPPTVWADTFTQLAERFPELSFVVAEYGPEPEAVLDILTDLPDGRGVGAFRWEPTLSGTWGRAMFDISGSSYIANEDEFAIFDEMRSDLGL